MFLIFWCSFHSLGFETPQDALREKKRLDCHFTLFKLLTPKFFREVARLFENKEYCPLFSEDYRVQTIPAQWATPGTISLVIKKTVLCSFSQGQKNCFTFYLQCDIYTRPLTYLEILHVVSLLLGKGLPFCWELYASSYQQTKEVAFQKKELKNHNSSLFLYHSEAVFDSVQLALDKQ